MTREVILFCDESDIRGKYYSNFYGGALVRSDHIDEVRMAIGDKKAELNFHGEVKWQKVTPNYLEKYIELMELFFTFVRDDKVKIRVMFSQNAHVATGLERYHVEHEYFILYYQFIKHAFGLQYANDGEHNLNVRAYFDKLPDSREKCESFKDHLVGLNRYPQFQRAGIRIVREQIAEVVSHKHDILQCLDIVLGAMQFRLNDKHKEKPEGAKFRGKKTIAKEKLYKFINSKIREIYPNFNIGVSTGLKGEIENKWHQPYRHWDFKPKNSKYDENATKK